MNEFSAVWKDLSSEKVAAGTVRRRIVPTLPHDIFLAETRPSGQRQVWFQLKGPVGESWRRAKSSRGIGVKVSLLSRDRSLLQVYERGRAHSDLFESLVEDLVRQVTGSVHTSQLDMICRRLIAWQAFFESSPDGLSLDSQAGLFAELTILSSVLAPRLGPARALEAWSGPEKALQDFSVGGLAIEVKSSRGSDAERIRISSERQLDRVGIETLLLVIVQLDARSQGTGTTLPELVRKCRDIFTMKNGDHLLFDELLIQSGYVDAQSSKYITRYSVRSTEWFTVADGFPCIVPSMLAQGVSSVRYEISRSSCQKWSLNKNDVDILLGGIK